MFLLSTCQNTERTRRYTYATIKAKLATLLSDPNFIAGCVVQLDTCNCSTNPLAAGKAWRTSGKCKHVRVAFVRGCTHLKIMNFTLISKSQIHEFCDFLTHGNERQFSVTPSLINKSISITIITSNSQTLTLHDVDMYECAQQMSQQLLTNARAQRRYAPQANYLLPIRRVKATSIAREAREKIFLRPPLNFEVRGGRVFHHRPPLDFCQGGANTP